MGTAVRPTVQPSLSTALSNRTHVILASTGQFDAVAVFAQAAEQGAAPAIVPLVRAWDCSADNARPSLRPFAAASSSRSRSRSRWPRRSASASVCLFRGCAGHESVDARFRGAARVRPRPTALSARGASVVIPVVRQRADGAVPRACCFPFCLRRLKVSCHRSRRCC